MSSSSMRMTRTETSANCGHRKSITSIHHARRRARTLRPLSCRRWVDGRVNSVSFDWFNALTERFYGTVKQEEIYLVGNYPDETSAREEIGRYIETYHRSRPHQALFNFTPAHVHAVNNKSALLQELNEMKRNTREKRRAYWAEQQKLGQTAIAGGTQGKDQPEIVDPGANTEVGFQQQQPDSQTESPKTGNDSLHSSILSH